MLSVPSPLLMFDIHEANESHLTIGTELIKVNVFSRIFSKPSSLKMSIQGWVPWVGNMPFLHLLLAPLSRWALELRQREQHLRETGPPSGWANTAAQQAK